jgi:hypothetical protein
MIDKLIGMGATADHALGVGVRVGLNPESVLFRQG